MGAVGFVLTDSEFKMSGIAAYGWVSAYLASLTFEMTYGKRLLGQVKFRSIIWGSTLYTNLLALPPMCGIAIFSGEADKLRNFEPDVTSMLWLGLACVVGIGISWSGWNCRDKVSATFYALLGVACKLISVLMNVMLWDKHASPQGIAWLLVCLFCSSQYKQAPLREGSAPSAIAPADPLKAQIAELEGQLQERDARILELEHRLAQVPVPTRAHAPTFAQGKSCEDEVVE